MGARVRFGKWSPMAWAILALVVVSCVVTVIVGIELYSITGHPGQFSTQ